MIISREFLSEDLSGIDDIFQRQPDLGVPSLNNIIINSTLVDDETGKIVGYGTVKLFAEATLILDREIRKRDKVQALREAMKTAIVFSKDAGLETLYVVTTSSSFNKALRKSYHFREYPGELLALDLMEKENEQLG